MFQLDPGVWSRDLPDDFLRAVISISFPGSHMGLHGRHGGHLLSAGPGID